MKGTTFPVFEAFDKEKICRLIQPPQLREKLSRLDVFDLINSTSTYLLECAKMKSISGWVCLAEQQSKGRGRLGRDWYSPRGASIYCSMLWQFPLGQTDLSALGLAVAVMVADALQAYGMAATPELKWPNDILVAKRKLCGILLERLPPQEGVVPVVIGIGINLQLPPEKDPQWIDLAEITGDAPVRRNDMAALLIQELLMQLPIYQESGFASFIPRWTSLDILAGKKVSVHASEAVISGTVTAISPSGELILRTDSGEIKRFRCGEVSVRF